jgi:L-glyceraldehyde 3-phosphate reductase
MYLADDKRYNNMVYRRCGNSGLKLPAISLGMWQNFGDLRPLDNSRKLLTHAFDLGITHFDLANNYGPSAGSAEETFGEVMRKDLKPYRDELIISTKAGYWMWNGPYGDWGSRKYLMASLDQSLKRMGLEYVDIFYHHRPDPETPLEETMTALADIVKQGKALYVGISNYGPKEAEKAIAILRDLGVHLLIHQPSYSMFNRWIEDGLQDVLKKEGVGSIAFCPLSQGILTNRYLGGIPSDSRVARPEGTLQKDNVDEKTINKVRKLAKIAENRGQTMAQMALAWVLRDGKVTSALIGASKVEQLDENVGAVKNLDFCKDELEAIEKILKDED